MRSSRSTSPLAHDGSAEVFAPRLALRQTHAAAMVPPAEVLRDAAERAGLGRVAALVAVGAAQDELFLAVVEEIATVVDAERTWLVLFDDGAATVVAEHDALDGAPTGRRWPMTRDLRRIRDAGQGVRFVVRDADTMPGAPTELDAGQVVGVPVVVSGRIWGAALAASAPDGAFPDDCEARMAILAQLLATPLAGTETREHLERLADEQAALRRVAELVARDVDPEVVFAAVAEETATLLNENTTLCKYEEEGVYSVVALSQGPIPLGTRLVYDPGCIAWRVKRSGTCERIDDYDAVPGAVLAHQLALRGAVGAPIKVDGALWGVLSCTSPSGPLPVGTEVPLAHFASLTAAALGSAASRRELAASRARVIAAADESRLKLQRDVHDGAQQRLAQAVLALEMARDRMGGRGGEELALVEEALEHAERAAIELSEVVRGVLPAALTRGGLDAGLEALRREFPLPVDLDVAVPRLAPAVERTAYFVVAEALANVVKHAQASRVHVQAALEADTLVVAVRDDGVGGADPGRGSGLTGLADRVAARDGSLEVHSPVLEGTELRVRLPASR